MEIKEFQNKIRKTYYDKDARRGKAETFRWLIEEIGELARAIRNMNTEELNEEFSDVCAWLFSLANLYEIDMESAMKKYDKGCPKCGKSPCQCKE